MAELCTLCCAETRNASCGDCRHYAAAQQYRATRRVHPSRAVKSFIAELDPAVEQAVDDALVLAQNGKTDQAWAAMTELLRTHPRNHEVCFGMGTLHALKEEHAQAIEWFDKATTIFPYLVDAHFNKAVAYQRLLDVGNAIRAYRKVVEVGGADDLIVKQARSFLDAMADSIRRTEGIDLDTYLEAQTEFDLAFAFMERGEWLRALDGFRACIAKNERHAPSHGNRGLCLAKLGRKAEALAALDRALAIDPRYKPAIDNRVAIKRMAEGHPLDVAGFKRVDYGKECVLGKKDPSRSIFGGLAALFSKH